MGCQLWPKKKQILLTGSQTILTKLTLFNVGNEQTGDSSVGQDSCISLGGHEFKSLHLRVSVIRLEGFSFLSLFLSYKGIISYFG